MDKSLPHVAAMLRTAEKYMKGKGKAILMVNNGKFKRQHKKPNKFKGNGKSKAVAKPSTNALKSTGGVAKEGKCFYCAKIGHWKRNCPKYLEGKKNGTVASTSSVAKAFWQRLQDKINSKFPLKGQLSLEKDLGDIKPLMPSLLLVKSLKVFDHIERNHILVLLLQLRGHCCKHDTRDFHGIIEMLTISIPLNPGAPVGGASSGRGSSSSTCFFSCLRTML
ncbi:hypothetical protein L195_g036321, partial [Trifolium pratense]